MCTDIGCSSHGAALLYANQLGILDPLCPAPESVAEAYEEDQDRFESAIPHKCILHDQARCDEAVHCESIAGASKRPQKVDVPVGLAVS